MASIWTLQLHAISFQVKETKKSQIHLYTDNALIICIAFLIDLCFFEASNFIKCIGTEEDGFGIWLWLLEYE